MGNPFNKPEFRKLFKEWNRILKETGHEEIEDFSRQEPVLVDWDSSRWRFSDPTICEWKHQYYEMAEEILKTYVFQQEEHRMIWDLHCKGISTRKIAQQMRRYKFGKSTICNVIRTIQRGTGLQHG